MLNHQEPVKRVNGRSVDRGAVVCSRFSLCLYRDERRAITSSSYSHLSPWTDFLETAPRLRRAKTDPLEWWSFFPASQALLRIDCVLSVSLTASYAFDKWGSATDFRRVSKHMRRDVQREKGEA